MRAFRVGLGVLFVLLLTSPASAQFKTADLNGPWLLHATRVGVRQAGEAGWLQGSLSFLQSGSLANDEVRDQDGVLVPLRPGALSVSSSGVVTGVLQLGSGNASIRGQFAEWNRIVGTATADAGAPDEVNAFFVMIRQPTGAFTQADAIGTWRLNTLLVPGAGTTTPEWVSGQIVVDGNGAITSGSLSSSNGSTATSATGTLFVDLDGDFSGQLDIGLLGNDHTVLSGTFDPGRELMVGAASRALPGEEQHGMFVLQREPTAIFAPADAGGTWEFVSIEALIDGNPVGAWRRGTLTADSVGVVTAGTLTDGFGTAFEVQGGLIVVEGHGFVFAQIFFDSGLDVLALQGSMLSNKAQIFGVDTFGGETVVPRLGFSTLVKPTAAGPTPAIVQFSRPGYTVTEGTASAVITVLSTGTSTTPFTVPYTATPVMPGQDFTPVSGTLSFAAGALSRTFSVPISNNPLVDGNRSILLTLGPPVGNAVLGQQATAALTILDNDQGGVIKLGAGTYAVAETAGSLLVTILRTGTNLAGNVSVAYTTGNGGALAGLDYTATTGTVTFGAGQTSRTVRIPILNDALVEPHETFPFTLFNPTGGASLGSPASALVTIKSEDAGGLVKFSAAAYRFPEGAGNVSVTVVRTGGTASDVTVDYTVTAGTAAAGADFAASSGTLTFAAQQTTATIPLALLQDQLAEGNESFTLALGNPQGGAALAAPSITTVTIVDDESAIQFSAGNYLGKEGTSPVITLLRSGPLTTPAGVHLAATPGGTAVPGVDFTLVPMIVSFAAGQSSKTVSVPILNNTLVQGNRTVLLGLSNPTGGAQLGTQATAVLTIPEDDHGGVIKLGAGTYAVAETAGSLLVTILRTGTNLAGNVSVAYTTGNGSALAGLDYTATTGTVTFGAGQTSRTVRIPILNDALVEPHETFPFTLFNPTGGASLGSPASALVTIKSEDAGGLVKFSAAAYRFPEGAGNVSVTVVRTGGTASDVTVDYTVTAGTAAAGADFAVPSGTLTFAAQQTTATIPLALLQDQLAEGNESFTLALGNPQGGAALAAPSITTVTIVDDEAVVEFSLRFVGNMPEVVRTGSLAAQATVDFVSEDGTATGGIDYLPLSGTLTFRPGVAAQYIPLVILPDILAEGPESFTLTLVNPQPQGVLGLGPRASQTLTIADNDFGGVVQFGTTATTAAPGESRDIPIVRTGSGAPVIVNWQTISGASSEAFSPTSGSVTFAAKETSRSFTINVADIQGNGPDVTAVFALSVAPGAATVGTPNSSTLTIFGPRAEVNMPLSDYSVVEGGGPAVVSVTRSGNLDRQVSVAYATSNDTALAGRDYTATSGRLTFAIGQQVATFTVPILDNGPSGQTRSLNLTLSSPSPATTIGEGGNARLQIREAPMFSYRLIADNTEGISGFGGVPSINDGGMVAFKAATTDDDVGVFTGNGGALTTIASVSADDLLGIDGSRFPIDAAGNVVFLATAGNERRTIFRGAGGTLTPLLQTGGTFTDLFDPSASPNGTVAFAAQAEGGVAIFTGPGAEGVSLFVAGGDEVFQEIGAFPGVNDDGAVAFVGVRRSGGGRSIFVANPSDGALQAVATGVTTDGLATISLNITGQVAFPSTLPAPDGPAILVGQDGSSPKTFVSTASGFQAFGRPEDDTSPVINALGNVAYLGLTLETFGILIGPDPDTSMVIREGDPLLGSNVASLRFGGYNAAGQIAFRANLLDGREVIVVGTPPAGSALADLPITNTVDAPAPSLGATSPFD